MMENKMRLSTRLLLCLANLLLFQIGSTLADNCTANTTCNTCSNCTGLEQRYVLTGTSQVDLSCNRNSGNGPWYHINEADNNNTIIRGSVKYGGSSNRLIIHNVVGTDEGRYQCQDGGSVQSAGCVFVLGRGSFATCSSRDCLQLDENTVLRDISVLAGGDIVFDTRVIFTESGPCGLPQDTGFFQLFKGNNLEQGNILYNCLGTNDPCPPQFINDVLNTPVYAIRGGGHRFNMSLTIRNAAMDDEGNYTFRVQLRSGEGSREPSIIFRVTVNPRPSPTVVPSTGTPVSSAFTAPTITVNPSTPPTSGVTPPVQAPVNAVAIAVPIAVVVVIIFIVIVIVLLVYVVHYQRRSQSMSVSDKPLPVRNNSYVPAESTVTTIDSGVKTKRDSMLEEVELPDHYTEDFGRNSEDRCI